MLVLQVFICSTRYEYISTLALILLYPLVFKGLQKPVYFHAHMPTLCNIHGLKLYICIQLLFN